MSKTSMTSAEVARLFRISRSEVQRRASAGELPVLDKAPGIRGAYLFDRTAIESMVGATC